MPRRMTREEFQTPQGRSRAWRSLMLDDHGLLRKVYDNTHQISDKMWRTFQPSPADLETWAAKGIRTVINLRGLRREDEQEGFYFLEEDTCQRLGLELINFRAYSREAPTKEFVFGIKELFERIDYPAILHCKSGADRAGIASALYLFLYEGRPLDEALEQLSFKYGHVKQGKTGILDYFFDLYREAATQAGVEPSEEHFLHWVSTDYDQESVRPNFKPTALGSFITETVLRRE
ncbi:MAG: tyrosine-protein phosphatase [Aquisalinus sp.]|nr:tyrosine-protein phosphatase [Aquisalinus sp.]